MAVFKGFNPADVITITVGAGGLAGTGNGNGHDGNDSTLIYSGITLVTAGAGHGGVGTSTPGAGGAFATTSTGTSLILNAKMDLVAETGATSAPYFVGGGNNGIGHSGMSSEPPGVLGGGGFGCVNNTNASGAGGTGVVIVRWES